MRRFLIVLALMMPVPVAAANAGPVLVLGDSLSAAHNIAVSDGWVHKVAERLAAREPARQVINASISGETSRSGRERLPALLQSHHPDVVILELGANDGLRGLPLESLRDNLAAMIEASRQAGARVLLLGIELPVNYGPRYRDGLRAVYTGLARHYQVRLLPFLLQGVALKPDLMQADGLHPNARGERIVFDNIWAELSPMLEAGD